MRFVLDPTSTGLPASGGVFGASAPDAPEDSDIAEGCATACVIKRCDAHHRKKPPTGALWQNENKKTAPGSGRNQAGCVAPFAWVLYWCGLRVVNYATHLPQQ